MENAVGVCVSFKDLTDKSSICIKEAGIFTIGLLSDGTLGILKVPDDLCVVLLTVSITDTGGAVLSPANRDLPCIVNNSTLLTAEINLINGTQLDIANKRLVFINGLAPKSRRKLPPTPGMPVTSAPPSKPARSTAEKPGSPMDHIPGSCMETETDLQLLETSWKQLDPPQEEKSLFKDFEAPEQIAILSATYFTKQLRLYTDAIVTSQLLDSIFKMFLDTVPYCWTTYQNYLSAVSGHLTRAPEKQTTTTTTMPMHGPAVKLLTELLQQCFDPISRVVLILDLLRTFSHFDNNLYTMVTCKTAAAVMGSMSAYLGEKKVQQLSLDILAKLALHKPGTQLSKKSPIREAAVDMVTRAARHYVDDISIVRAACRLLANLSSTLVNVLNAWMDNHTNPLKHSANLNKYALSQKQNSLKQLPSETVLVAIETYMSLLNYVFEEGVPVVQEVLTHFRGDLGVNTEGRKFIFYYAKLSQIQQKAAYFQEQVALRESAADKVTDIPADRGDVSEPQGILKKSRSYENLKTKERKLCFAGGTEGGSASDSDSSSLDSSDADSDASLSDSESDEENHGPEFESKLCKEINMEDDFSFHVVKSLVKKTVRRRKKTLEREIDSDDEFLDSYSAKDVKRVDAFVPYSAGTQVRSDAPDGLIINANEQADTRVDRDVVNQDFQNPEINGQDSTVPVITKDLQEHKTETEMNTTDSDRAVIPTTSPASGLTRITTEETDERASGCGNEADAPGQLVAPVPAPRKRNAPVNIYDVPFMGKLVRTQIICHIGQLVFKGEDSEALMVIDRPVKSLLLDSSASPCLVSYAENQYGVQMTLMDLEPAIVIGVIDAVRYRHLTQKLVQAAVLSLTQTISETLHQSTVDCLMLFYKQLFSETSLSSILTEKDFLTEFRSCFQQAVSRLCQSHSIGDIHKHLKEQLANFAV